jgi:hypothetical protein
MYEKLLKDEEGAFVVDGKRRHHEGTWSGRSRSLLQIKRKISRIKSKLLKNPIKKRMKFRMSSFSKFALVRVVMKRPFLLENFSKCIPAMPNLAAGQTKIIDDLTIEIKGKGVFADLRYETGVHRVQRVPATEKMGRVHTSTVTVSILPIRKKFKGSDQSYRSYDRNITLRWKRRTKRE